MSFDTEKALADLKAAARPELEKRAVELRSHFLKQIEDFTDQSQVHVLDELLEKAANYEIEAVTQTDPNKARQYAEAAEDVLRQVRLVVITEKIVASKELAAMVEAAALSVWEGFKTVATGLLGVAIKGVATGLFGSVGGAAVDAAAEFLGDAIGDDDGETANA